MNEIHSALSDLKEQFRATACFWQQREKDIGRLADGIEKQLGPRLNDAARNQLRQKREVMGDAVQELTERAAHPELVLATTGTTSSGKSTLANFLIGEEILPSAVQEMSAGLVIVRHHDTRRMLRISSTRGATWETGAWDTLTAQELRQRLEETMDAYRAAEKDNPDIEAVQFEIDWPIRLALEKARFGLPAGTRVTILDLPGLKAIDDERNGPLIRENVSQALCLVAYNAEETDDRKQKELLNQVVSQVTALRKTSKSLGRMLFLLNRIDAFARNADPAASFEKFKAYVTQQLRAELLKALPEESAVIGGIEPAAISSLPALYAAEAHQSYMNADRQLHLLEMIERFFAPIFPQRYWRAFRDFDDLTDDQRRHLIADTFRYSRADDFEQRLGDHIAANLPELVLAAPADAAFNAAGTVLMELDLLLEAHSSRTIDEAKAARKRLAEIHDTLAHKADEVIDLVKGLTPDKSAGWLAVQDLGDKLEKVEEKLSLPQDRLTPIRDFTSDVLQKSYNNLADYCADIMNGDPDEASSIANASNFQAFQDALLALRNSPYGRVWKEGGEFRSGAEAEAVKIAWQNFAEQLSGMATYMVRRSLQESCVRTDITFKELAAKCVARIENSVNTTLEHELKAFPGLKTIFHGEVTFPKYESTTIKLFPKIEDWSRNEKKVVEETRQERVWYTLWLWRAEVKHEVEKMVSIKGVAICGLGDVLKSFYESAEIKTLHDNINSHLSNMIDVFVRHVRSRIESGVDAYKTAIDESVQKVDHQQVLEIQATRSCRESVAYLLQEHGKALGWDRAASLALAVPA